ncbi:MAG TPA: helix-turn-helix transcriptional regulator [Myxococcota bacterium]|nr:helix-turn-helix transcriptional regulator [Myxococcota bacterium]HRY92817.1 helix-turn-helix transcriptional regulator [Myxococcota bacterium]HSA19807.1 helix-turn-helix transcriptional regulator [Myxococcota bacterium]
MVGAEVSGVARYSQAQVLELIQALYTVAEGTANWGPVLEKLRALTRSEGAVVRRANYDSGEGEVVFGSPMHADVQIDYARLHPSARTLVNSNRDRFVTEGVVVTRRMVVAAPDFEASAFYREFLAPRGFYDFMNMVFEVRGSWVLNLTMVRSPAAGDYDDEDVALFQALAPHLRRAMELYRLLAGALNLSVALENSIDHLPIGVILVDALGKAIAVNRSATELLGRHEGLQLGADGLLRAAEAEAQAELGRLIAEASRCGASATGCGGTLNVTSSSGGRALALLVTPLRLERQALEDPRVLAAVFVRDPDHRPAATEEALQQLYGLTRAESRLASLLVSGLSLEESAKRLGVTTNTARTHLKRVFAKTQTSRQGDLVSLLLSGVEALRPPSASA